MKKVLTALVFILIFTFTVAFANEEYPLQGGENLLEETIISENKVEIFTETNGEYFKKILEKQDEIWIEVESTEVELPSVGLKEDENVETDYAVEQALENKLRASGFSLEALPPRLDLSDLGYLPPVGRQYEDSCVGWSTGYYLRTFQQAKDIGWNVGDNPKHIFSPSFIYNQINEGVDQGATLQDAGDLLQEVGAATLYDFPYVPKDYWTQPSYDVIQKAELNKIRNWYVLYTKNDSPDYIINKTKEYLNTGDLPVVGINVGFKWSYPLIQPDGTSIVTTEQYTSGGHAVAVVGYDDNIETPDGYGAFKIVNSYGEEWGEDGYTYMTYNAFASAMRSGFVFTDLVNGRIVDEMDSVNSTLVDENTVKFDWKDTTNASGYKVLDESFNVIANVYDSEYTENIEGKKYIKRYFQAFNSLSSSNVVEAEVNLNNTQEEIVPVEIEDKVEFQMNFSGSGRYDVRIKDLLDSIIKEDLNNQGKTGLNVYTWDGKNKEGNTALNGNYKLELVPYKGAEAKEPVTLDFGKKSKVESASAKRYKLDGNTYKLEVNVTAKENGKVYVYAVNKDTEEEIITDESINAGETKVYKIGSSKVDLNDENINIKVVVK